MKKIDFKKMGINWYLFCKDYLKSKIIAENLYNETIEREKMNKLNEYLEFKQLIFSMKELISLIISFRKILEQTIEKNYICIVYHLKSLLRSYFIYKNIFDNYKKQVKK